jgi:uncharacterized protein (DUF302 family)
LASTTVNGILQVVSKYPFAETVARLESAITSRGLTIFFRIDFSGDAAKAGLRMNPTRLVIFGNPKTGTPLMIAAPTVAIDFPLKVLVSEDSSGKVVVSYNTPEYLAGRHNIPEDLVKNIAGIEPVVRLAVGP